MSYAYPRQYYDERQRRESSCHHRKSKVVYHQQRHLSYPPAVHREDNRSLTLIEAKDNLFSPLVSLVVFSTGGYSEERPT
mmetsp:Transcript_24708/g.40760  ORF Transcript_24708/g.40760 Transcript_24708/m.40760 type:complete len:80 (-) Transcript_24708:18-257(-)